MALLKLMDPESEQEVITVVLDFEPYNGEVEVDVFPKTRALVMKAIDNAKKNPIYRRHTRLVDGKRVAQQGRPEDAFVQEIAKLLIAGWRGVVDGNGLPVECTDEAKVLLFNNIEVANFITDAASRGAVLDLEEDTKNF